MGETDVFTLRQHFESIGIGLGMSLYRTTDTDKKKQMLVPLFWVHFLFWGVEIYCRKSRFNKWFSVYAL